MFLIAVMMAFTAATVSAVEGPAVNAVIALARTTGVMP
jgi:hypothetical protein